MKAYRPHAVCFSLAYLFFITLLYAQADGSWIPLGPSPENATGFSVNGGVSGRVWAISVSPNYDRNGHAAMYIGVGGGGVWRSTNFMSPAPTWVPLSDHFPASIPLTRQIRLQNIGALAVDPNHPWIIYAGSGDPAGSIANLYGTGLLKSVDGGTTWSWLSLTANTFTPGFTRIIVDPTDNSGATVYATAGFGPGSAFRGIYRSKNGGSTWRVIQTGMPDNVAISDLDYTVNKGVLTLYAGLTDLSGNNSRLNGIWQTFNKGDSWRQMEITALTDLKGQAYTNSAIGTIKLAADHSPGTGHGFFAAISNAINSEVLNVFQLNNNKWVPSGNGIKGITSAYAALSIGISEAGIVYLGMGNNSQDGIYQSVDGGKNWSSIFPGSDGSRPHHDQRCWGFFSGQVFEGNDGGVSRFVPLPNGKAGAGRWESLNTKSLQTILSQSVGIHPLYPNVLVTGSQDNGVALRSGGVWNYVTGDDDGRCRFDEHDGNFVYRTGVSDPHFFFRSSDGGKTWPDDRSVPGGTHIGSYVPFVCHPGQPGRLALGLNQVYETTDRGDHWKAISTPLAGEDVVIQALAYADNNVIYASFGGRLFKTVNGGGNGSNDNWTELRPNSDWQGDINSIAVDYQNTHRVYLATTGGAVWQSTTDGTAWQNITSNFPAPPFSINAITLRSNSPLLPPTLFVATSVGVYRGSASGSAWIWTRPGSNFPDVEVTDIQFNRTNKYLYAATYGRGVFANYTHFLTTNALGAASLNKVVFTFCTDFDGRICLNQAQAGQAFSGWFELQGKGQTNSAPAATALQSSIFVFIRGLNNQILLNQAEFGHPFSGWQEVQGNGHTDASPAAASIGNTVYVVVKGLDGNVYKNEADFGHAFGNWTALPGGMKTNTAPAVVTNNNTIYVFVKGLDGKVYKNEADKGHSFGGWFPMGPEKLTDVSPAAAILNNTIYLIIKGTDGHVYKNEADIGKAFSGWFELQGGGTTDAAPVVTTVGQSLFVFMKSLDGRIQLNQAEFRRAFSGWFEVGGGIQ